MNITKQLAFLCFLFFLLNIVGPTLVVLHSNVEVSTVVVSLEKETETKDIEDLKEFTELDFDKTPLQGTHSFITQQSLSFVFYNKTLSEIHLENILPPPEYV